MTNAAAVLGGAARHHVECADALAFLRSLPTASVSLVLFSPPYEAARQYNVAFKLRGQEWVDWMRPIVVESARVSSGLVAVNASGQVRGQRYSPVVEWLVADLTRHDGLVCGPMPYAWVRPGIPGSGNKQYHRRNWEPVYCFARPENIPLKWSDNRAFGKAPKYAPGGEMSHRMSDGRRVNQWGPVGSAKGMGARKANGTIQKRDRPSHKLTQNRRRQGGDHREEMDYTPPAVANPGNVIRTANGGNSTGHPLAHENEAPMNLAVAERFVCWYAAPDTAVCDPFSGSGTTAHAAILHGRRFVGADIRESQVALTLRRLATVTPSMFA